MLRRRIYNLNSGRQFSVLVNLQQIRQNANVPNEVHNEMEEVPVNNQCNVDEPLVQGDGKNEDEISQNQRCKCKHLYISISISLISILIICLLISALIIYYPNIIEYLIHNPSKYRLNENVKILSYQLNILPFLPPNENKTFEGNVTIAFILLKNSSKITLNAYKLNITSMHLSLMDVEHVESINIQYEYDDKYQLLQLHNKSIIFMENQRYLLKIEYLGKLNLDSKGLVITSYTSENQTKWLAFTKMQPIYARQVFPCFDEPKFTATFQINIGHPNDLTVHSNTNVESVVTDKSRHDIFWTKFAKTPRMSIYLLAFVIHDYKNLTQENDRRITIWTKPSEIENAKYALDLAVKFLNHFGNISGNIVPKLDVFTIPVAYHSGGKENLGLIMIQDKLILYEKKLTTIFTKHQIAITMAMKIAHQLIGNHIPIVWWPDIWMIEAYTTLRSFICIDKLLPENNVFDIYYTHEKYELLYYEAISNQRKLNQNINTPIEIESVFNKINYDKVNAIVMMLHDFSPRNSPLMLLKDDLLDGSSGYVMDIQSKYDSNMLKMVRDTWSTNIGHPVVNITKNLNRTILSQERFINAYAFSIFEKMLPQKSVWYIPITLTIMQDENINQSYSFILPDKVHNAIKIPELNDDKSKWLLVNVNRTGYYRINYDLSNWHSIINYLHTGNNYKKISKEYRAQLINDAIALAEANYINFTITLEILSYLSNETEYLPWFEAINILQHMDYMFMRSGIHYKFRNFVQHLIRKVFHEITIDIDKPKTAVEVMRKIKIFQFACRMELWECIEYSRKMFSLWLTNKPNTINPIPEDLRSTVYCTVIGHSELLEVHQLWSRVVIENSPIDKKYQLYGLSCSNSEENLRKLLFWALNEQIISKEYFNQVLKNIIDNKIGFDIFLRFVKQHKEYILWNFPTLMEEILVSLRKCNTEEDLIKLKSILECYGEPSEKFAGTLMFTQLNIKWMQQNSLVIMDWLRQKYIKNNPELD